VAGGRYALVSYDRAKRELRVDERGRLPGIPGGKASVSYWKNYFDLGRDYAAIKRRLSESSPTMKEAVSFGSGIRILRQEPFETLISFIISQNNHIPRIRACIETLCREFGEEITPGVFAFPTVDALAALSEADLGICRLGYRAPYIEKVAARIAEDGGAGLARAAKSGTDEAEKYLTSLHGVGPKVAHCIMLYGMGKLDVFPVDTWMKKVMSRLAGVDEKDAKAMHAYAKKAYGEYCGIAQQYLFYFARSGGV
jgi:N-glycosylase/DNA lyase